MQGSAANARREPGNTHERRRAEPETSRMQQEMAEAKAARRQPDPLKITFGDKSAEWTAATLAPLRAPDADPLQRARQGQRDLLRAYRSSICWPSWEFRDKPRGKEFRLYLVAEGSDGYQVVYSIGEVTPDVHDGSVIVADSLDGKPIGNDGPLKLVATGEKRPARWVRNLVAIRVLTAQ